MFMNRVDVLNEECKQITENLLDDVIGQISDSRIQIGRYFHWYKPFDKRVIYRRRYPMRY